MQYMDNIVKLLGVEYGEFFSVKGRSHTGHAYRGDECDHVFVEYSLLHAMWPADVDKAIHSDSAHHLPLATDNLHAILCGMLVVVRSKPGKRKVLPSYEPNMLKLPKEAGATTAYQSTLF